jgi:hypothetical protein
MERRSGPGEAYEAIESFVKSGREPALLEPGESHFALRPGNFSLDWHNGRLTLQVWDEQRNLARRIAGVEEQKPGKMVLRIERFGKQEGRIYLLDLARGATSAGRQSARMAFREAFRRSLWRNFPDWRIAELSMEPNLRESLSPAYPRALLRKGASGCAVLGVPPEPGAGAGALTFALIWLDYLRRRERRLAIESLALFLPDSDAQATCLRLRWLDPRAARFATYVYSKEGYEEQVDPRDFANLYTRFDVWHGPSPALAPEAAAWVERICRIPYVERKARGDGAVALCVRGLEFARAAGAGLTFGLERKTPAFERHIEEIEALAREIARLRSPTAPDHGHPLYRLQPEGWLESQVRAHIERIGPQLAPSPVYGQVPAFGGGERGVIDLLAADRDGRLSVIELKASEDIHLPLQALDYWMRVKWHLDRREFAGRGYFPGQPLGVEAPRLLLVAPALEFHPKTEVILRYLTPEIEVERVGLAAGWRENVEVMFRARGAERPGA